MTMVRNYSRRYRLIRAIKKIPNLVVYYPMQEVEGTTCRNYAPKNRGALNGTIAGAIALGQPGRVGRCYKYDATNGEMVSITNTSALDISGKITYIFLSNLHTAGGGNSGRIFDKGTNLLLMNSTPQFQHQNNGTPSLSNTKSFDTDYLIVSAYDQTNVNFYFNGALDKAVGNVTNPQVNTTQLTLGNRTDGIRAADGRLSHMAIVADALSLSMSRKIAHLAGLI